MTSSFERTSKYFFWTAGLATALGAMPTALSPVGGFRLSTRLSYFDESPQVFPVIGHWGVMVAGIGVVLFLSATRKELRKAVTIYSTVEKSYIVTMALYCLLVGAPYAGNYVVPMVGDSAMVAGGIWYLWRSRQLGQE